MKTITHVAVKYRTVIFYAPPNFRHHQCLWAIGRTFGSHSREDIVQGFLDSDDHFVGRKRALVIATEANQLLPDRPVHGDELYSENVWAGPALTENPGNILGYVYMRGIEDYDEQREHGNSGAPAYRAG